MKLKTPKFRSRAYLMHVASLPCLVCRTSPCQAHHLIGGRHGMGMKAGDDMTVPLCPICHASLHADGNETRWLAERGIDGPALAATMYQRWRTE